MLDFTTFELPALAGDAARIEVNAAGINPVDARRMTGELPLFFGTEYAGTSVELNGNSGGWVVGDEVIAMTPDQRAAAAH